MTCVNGDLYGYFVIGVFLVGFFYGAVAALFYLIKDKELLEK